MPSDSPFAERVYVQWPELAGDARSALRRHLLRPRMIFVTVGTNEAPFDRLWPRWTRIETRSRRVQHGSSPSAWWRDVR